VNPVGARQIQKARKLSTPTKEGNRPRNEKDEDEDDEEKNWRTSGTLGYIKIDQHVFTSWHIIGGLASGALLSFLPSS